MTRVLEALISGQMNHAIAVEPKKSLSEYLEPDVRIIMGHHWNNGWWEEGDGSKGPNRDQFWHKFYKIFSDI